MEKELNIAEILKDKPQGIRLYSPIFGECAFCSVQNITDSISVKKHNGEEELFNSKGLYCTLGEVMLYPSRDMRDWSKFAWKKGDVLVSNDGKETIFFDRFADDTYTKFVGKYVWGESVPAYRRFSEKEETILTKNYSLEENKENIKKHILTVEACILKAGLNIETLETIPLKDGDIYFCKTYKDIKIGVFKSLYEDHNEVYISNYVHYHANVSTPYLDYSYDDWVEGGIYRPATNEEKKQLFEALAKEGKGWDAEKKAIVKLKPKIELKPFDKVLVRDCSTRKWEAELFGFKSDTGRYHCVGGTWSQCIPYIGNESLLGTTKDVEE